MSNNRFVAVAKTIGNEIKECVTTKWIGFYVTLAAFALSIAHTFAYSAISRTIYNGQVIVFSVLGIVAFILFSLYRRTSLLAPIALMISSFLSLTAFIKAEGIIDYLSTVFFDGFSMGKLFSLPFPVWFSMVSFVLCFIIASVAMYIPQNRKIKETVEKNSASTTTGEDK
ncbi:MAG: hypothetical protein GX756_00465 [Clostridiales bacterium]|jgi:hypothetical protein|nr:hypothetical protein [Clostridiales bacterium]